jgi:transcriptional regulator with XRE-family HTH domain
MPKSPQALLTMPPAASQALRALGENLSIARSRRRESQRVWAQRLGVSVPTLIRLERGDPGVGAGIYATALWLIGRSSALADVAAPEHDRGALESDVRAAITRRAARSAASAEARLARQRKQLSGH